MSEHSATVRAESDQVISFSASGNAGGVVVGVGVGFRACGLEDSGIDAPAARAVEGAAVAAPEAARPEGRKLEGVGPWIKPNSTIAEEVTYMPTLRLLHQYPNIMKKLQVDRGAIRFVLAGANIMCPGLTSPGGALDEDVGAECPVAIMAEGKQHALAIGFTKMSAKDIKAINKGIGVDNLHYLNDGLWKMERLD
uniref:Malignant T cell amplified sequence 1-B n=2 Tax=Cajanus cajan TaxID=3821 RepID=A0A151TK77_CAJCA|nr:Malignant T cell amplified sequence 1-B [Cajanus cajan]